MFLFNRTSKQDNIDQLRAMWVQLDEQEVLLNKLILEINESPIAAIQSMRDQATRIEQNLAFGRFKIMQACNGFGINPEVITS